METAELGVNTALRLSQVTMLTCASSMHFFDRTRSDVHLTCPRGKDNIAIVLSATNKGIVVCMRYEVYLRWYNTTSFVHMWDPISQTYYAFLSYCEHQLDNDCDNMYINIVIVHHFIITIIWWWYLLCFTYRFKCINRNFFFFYMTLVSIFTRELWAHIS